MQDAATKERYRSTQKQGNFFYDSLGSYCFYTQSVDLSGITADDLRQAARLGSAYKDNRGSPLPEDLYSKLKKIHPLSAHEYTHFLDSTATVWGLDLLVSLYRSYGVGDNESEFFHAKDAHEKIESIKMPSYYSLVDASVSPTQPWKYSISSGSIFDKNGKPSKRQIPFLRFSNSNDVFIARVPISLLSMLEASSTFQELRIHAALIQELSGDTQAVENVAFGRNFMNRLYDSQLTEYSVCTHLVANWHGINDAMIAYFYSSMLSRFCLNISFEDISQFSIIDAVATSLHLDGSPQRHEIIERLNSSLAAGDRAVLFFVLARTCELPSTKSNSAEIRDILSRACQMFGLELRLLEEASQETFFELHKQLLDLPNVPPELAASCLHNFKTQGEIFNVEFDFPSLELPPAMYGDCNPRPSLVGRSNVFKDFDAWQHFLNIEPRQEWMRQFSGACLIRPH